MMKCPAMSPIGPLPVVSHTRCQPPSYMRQRSVPENLPPGPMGEASIVPSSFQVPTNRSSAFCSAPGFGAVICADTPPAPATITSAPSHILRFIDDPPLELAHLALWHLGTLAPYSPRSIFFHRSAYCSTLSRVTTSTPELMIGFGGIRPLAMPCSSRTDSLPQPKYFWPSSTCTLPSRRSARPLSTVSNEITLVIAGSTAASALRAKTGQPPTAIHAARSG